MGMSARDLAGTRSRKRAALSYRQKFAERWAAFLQRHFDSPEEAAVFFGCDGSTARKQWQGLHAPSAYMVAMAYEDMGEGAALCLRGQS